MSNPTEPKASKRPSSTAFKQQRLKAWQPILTAKTVLPTFFVVGVVFVAIGIGLYFVSNDVVEIMTQYTTCTPATYNGTGSKACTPLPSSSGPIPVVPLSGSGPEMCYFLQNGTDPLTNRQIASCSVTFKVDKKINGPVFFYYRLENFYQNHRRYVRSVDTTQLRGVARSRSEVSTCDPLIGPTNSTAGAPASNQVYYPCGLIANSLFNDTYELYRQNGSSVVRVPINEKNIAWPTDISTKFQSTQYPVGGIAVPPPNWRLNYSIPDVLKSVGQNEHLMVWMRTAGLPTFRKLWGRIPEGLEAGTYQLLISDNFPVDSFGGEKGIVFSTTSWLGGKNPFLGIAYMAVGSVCLLLGFVFVAKQIHSPRKLGDHTLLSWNQKVQ